MAKLGLSGGDGTAAALLHVGKSERERDEGRGQGRE
jgi:hypothetical protein